jgi:hypothetical protein
MHCSGRGMLMQMQAEQAQHDDNPTLQYSIKPCQVRPLVFSVANGSHILHYLISLTLNFLGLLAGRLQDDSYLHLASRAIRWSA